MPCVTIPVSVVLLETGTVKFTQSLVEVMLCPAREKVRVPLSKLVAQTVITSGCPHGARQLGVTQVTFALSDWMQIC